MEKCQLNDQTNSECFLMQGITTDFAPLKNPDPDAAAKESMFK